MIAIVSSLKRRSDGGRNNSFPGRFEIHGNVQPVEHVSEARRFGNEIVDI
jgi:hypothetical protein